MIVVVSFVVGVLFVFFSHDQTAGFDGMVKPQASSYGQTAGFVVSGWRRLTPEVLNKILNEFLPCPVAFPMQIAT